MLSDLQTFGYFLTPASVSQMENRDQSVSFYPSRALVAGVN